MSQRILTHHQWGPTAEDSIASSAARHYALSYTEHARAGYTSKIGSAFIACYQIIAEAYAAAWRTDWENNRVKFIFKDDSTFTLVDEVMTGEIHVCVNDLKIATVQTEITGVAHFSKPTV